MLSQTLVTLTFAIPPTPNKKTCIHTIIHSADQLLVNVEHPDLQPNQRF